MMRSGSWCCWRAGLAAILALAAIDQAAASVQVSSRDPRPACRAVIVGVSDYQDPSVSDLTYCDDDAQGMYWVLRQNGWQASNMTLLVNGAARKSAIQQAVAAMKAAAGPGDVCLFYFSGHGDYGPDDDGDEARGANGYDEFLCPYDTRLADYSRHIRDDELAEWLSGFATDNLCVILDSCFSGGMTYFRGLGVLGMMSKSIPRPQVPRSDRDGFAQDLLRRVRLSRDIDETIPGIEVLMACTEDEYSWEDPWLQHGVFTYFVIECMASWSADRNYDGLMTAQEVYSCAAPQATDYIRRYFYELMYPRFYDNHPGDLVLLALPPCPLPVCEIVHWPEGPVIDEEVCFDSMAASECGVDLVEWDYGDGNTGDGETSCHTYTRAGTFTVVCTVTDGEGYQGTCSSSVRVRDENCQTSLGVVTCSCSMPGGKVGQTKSGHIAARNWCQEPCLAVVRVRDNVGETVFERTVTIAARSRVRLRFSHRYTEEEVGRGLWTWEVWPLECAEQTHSDNVRRRRVTVREGAPAGCPGYCQAVLGMCVQYVVGSPGRTVCVEADGGSTLTFGGVGPGALLCVDAGSMGLTELPDQVVFKVYDGSEYDPEDPPPPLREDVIDTSCSQPIYPGQPVGAFQVIEAYLQPCT